MCFKAVLSVVFSLSWSGFQSVILCCMLCADETAVCVCLAGVVEDVFVDEV